MKAELNIPRGTRLTLINEIDMLIRRTMVKTVGALSLANSALTAKSVLAQRDTAALAGASRSPGLRGGVTLRSIHLHDGSETLGVKTPNSILDRGTGQRIALRKRLRYA